MTLSHKEELREAIRAGQKAQKSLQEALDALNSVGRWGLLDMFGGGMIVSLAKHARLDTADELLDQARIDLQAFARELGDVGDFPGISSDVGEFLRFADIFFDGPMDVVVQLRVNKAKKRVRLALNRVSALLAQLTAML